MGLERGYWRIVIHGIEPTESDLEHIAELIASGYTEGEIIHEDEGTEGQDRENYTDTQDRENYTIDDEMEDEE